MDTPADWRDTLVELHVLTEHGDRAAAAAAQRWMARDARARQAWDTVRGVCDAVRRSTPPETSHEMSPRP